MKLLAIDYGERRIGVAVSDALGMTARPLRTIDRQKEKTFEALRVILDEQKPEKIIFGLPLDEYDEENEKCKQIRNFVKRLYDKLKIDLPHDFQDESFSTVRTHQLMRQTRGRKKRGDKKSIDTIAAAFILEDYLKMQNGGSFGDLY